MELPVIQIRQALASDALAACALLRRAIEQGCAADHGGDPVVLSAWLGNKTPQNVEAWFGSPTNYAVVAEHEGELAGLALLNQAGKLALCYVQPALARQGIGRALLAAVVERARCWSIGKIHMHSPASASGFFERLGYVNAGKDRACFGLEVDLLWKQLDATGAPARKRFCNCSGR
jgi:L-amino acid N-acyltransferase YncA